MSDPAALPVVAELLSEVHVHVMAMGLAAEAEDAGVSMFWAPGTDEADAFEAGVSAGAAAMIAALAGRDWLSIPPEAVADV